MSVEFPIIQIGHRGTFLQIYRNEDAWTSCSAVALRGDYFAPPVLIIDRALVLSEVANVRKMGTIGALGGFSLRFGRRFRIAYEIASQRTINIETARNIVNDTVRSNGNRWTATGYTIEEVVQRVEGASAFDELLRAIDID